MSGTWIPVSGTSLLAPRSSRPLYVQGAALNLEAAILLSQGLSIPHLGAFPLEGTKSRQVTPITEVVWGCNEPHHLQKLLLNT